MAAGTAAAGRGGAVGGDGAEYMHSKLFCTAWEFAPAARVPRVPGEGRLEGSQAEGLAGRYPPLHSYGWDDKSV